MSKTAFYNGILYQIEYQPQLSNSDYTQHKVYHIKTDEIWSKGLWQMKNKQEPSMVNAFHVYYEFSYNEDLVCMYILLSDLMMIKNAIIVVLLLLVGVLTGVCIYQNDTISKAKAYINDLENDFPEYIDTTSGGDAYSDWYN